MDLDAGFYNSPVRLIDAPNTSDIPAGGAEGPVTLTSLTLLWNMYVQKVDTLEKDLKQKKENSWRSCGYLGEKGKEIRDSA